LSGWGRVAWAVLCLAPAQLEVRLEQARSARHPVLLVFEADWCGACRVLERGTLKDSRVAKAAASFDWVRVDMSADDEVTSAVSSKYGVESLPTIVVRSSSGAELARAVGTLGPEALVRMLTETASRQ
jgi:thiol:disulfide interchange protein